jgi:hypothetical protein
MSCTMTSMAGVRGVPGVLLVGLVLLVGCKSTEVAKGRCDKASDCSGGLTCDDHHTCVPTTVSTSPCANDGQCGSNYACDNLQWCVCQVPNSNLSSSADPCTNGTLPPYRGVTTDGGMGDGAGGGDGGAVCHGDAGCSGTTPFCGSSGACVGCRTSGDCPVSTSPICDPTTNTCVPCTNDAQCVAKLGSPDPGVCMFHQDGHCALSSETVYVQSKTGCVTSASTSAGTVDMPFCRLDAALASASTKSLILIRGSISGSATASNGPPISIIGQSAAILPDTGVPGLLVTGTAVYARALKIAGGDNIGIVVNTGGSIRLDGVTVDSMAKGGILVDATAATFDIRNTTVTNNGPGQQGATPWGGILLLSAPDGGASSLDLVTIENNKWTGLVCLGTISGTGVLASGNTSGDIAPACGITSCTASGATCGAP